MTEKVYGKKLLELIPKLDFMLEKVFCHNTDTTTVKTKEMRNFLFEIRDVIQEETRPEYQLEERHKHLNATNAIPITDAVNAPAHYVGKIETIDYLRDKLTPAEFTGFCMGNVLKYTSRWRKKRRLAGSEKSYGVPELGH